jgi:SAM-dependent methyltransferase
MAILLQQDLANIEAGLYPLPADHDGSLLTLLDRSRLFFEDLPEIHQRRERGAHNEVLAEETRGKRPRYYLQNFHFQSGGRMTGDSASRYDTQVEVLFNGTANATRRQALPQLHEIFAGRDQRKLRLLDIGCGTGRFLDFLKQAWPRLPVLGLDMSEPYVRYAKRHLKRWSRINLIVGNAESLPVPDESQDAVTSIFLFHEFTAEGAAPGTALRPVNSAICSAKPRAAEACRAPGGRDDPVAVVAGLGHAKTSAARQ